jgi:hypothetical protein
VVKYFSIVFQIRHTRSPSDNTLHLSTNEFVSKKFTLERADSAGDTMQGYATRVDSAGDTIQACASITDSADKKMQDYTIADNAVKASHEVQIRTGDANAVVKYSADNESGLGRPVGLSYSCPRPFHYGGDLTSGAPEKNNLIRRTAVECESKINAVRGKSDIVDSETAPQEEECLLQEVYRTYSHLTYSFFLHWYALLVSSGTH